MKVSLNNFCNGNRKATHALTLLEFVIVLVIIFFLAVLLLPTGSIHNNNKRSRRLLCMDNLHQIGIGFNSFAGDNGNNFPAQISLTSNKSYTFSTNLLVADYQSLGAYLDTPVSFTCLADSRQKATNFQSLSASNISYFLSADATMKQSNAIIAGDRNLEIGDTSALQGFMVLSTNRHVIWGEGLHSTAKNSQGPGGNLLFSDGNVVFAKGDIDWFIQAQNMPTNRIFVP